MAVNLSMLAGAAAQFFDNNGVILSGGLVYTYAAGTTTPQAVYTTSAGSIAHANPIVLDSAGRVPSGGEIWLTDVVSYKFVLKTATATTIGTYDNVTGNSSGFAVAIAGIYTALAAPTGSSLVGYLPSGTGAVATTVQSKLRESISFKDYGAVADGTTNDTTAVNNAVTKSLNSSGAITLSSAMSVGTALPSLGGAQFIGNKPITYNLGLGYGKTVANRRGRDLAQKVEGQSYLARFWNILSFFGVSYTASV